MGVNWRGALELPDIKGKLKLPATAAPPQQCCELHSVQQDFEIFCIFQLSFFVVFPAGNTQVQDQETYDPNIMWKTELSVKLLLDLEMLFGAARELRVIFGNFAELFLAII